MDSTNRGAFSRFFSDKGRVLSEEEQAKENVYIQVLFGFSLFGINLRNPNPMLHAFLLCTEMGEGEIGETEAAGGEG